MALKSIPHVTAVALLSGAAALASCSSNSANTSSGSSSSSSSSSGTGGAPSRFQADAPEVYLAKIKNILIGQPPTDAEIQQVTKDPTQLKALIDLWMKDPAYNLKMRRFFELAFQQTQINSASFIDMILPGGMGPGEGVPLLVENLSESFARTMVELTSTPGHALTEAMTTKTFMMTPPVMELYAYLDAIHASDVGKVDSDSLSKDYPQLQHIVQGTAGLANVTLAELADPSSPFFMHFYNPDVAGLTYGVGVPNCNNIDPINYPVSSFHVQWIMYGAVYNHQNTMMNGNCGSKATKGSMLFSADDFGEKAWKMVTVRPPKQGEKTTRFFDIPSLRTATELVINTPRVGYFSTPAFFANWSTNSSNQMRVTLNQALIVATGTAVDGLDPTGPTIPPGATVPPGVDTDHTAPQTDCYGCHQTLDPTRAILSATWTYPYYTQKDPAQIAEKGEFAFRGVKGTVNTIDDFASLLATHPLVASAWVQKLCYYANSQACDATDPEFLRVVGLFKSSGFDWSTAVRELLASPLTTNAASTVTTEKEQVVAVSRRDHLCAALDFRLGLDDVCGLQVTTPKSTITAIANGLPSDGYGRGSTAPVLPNQPTLFYRAGLENICEAVAKIVIDSKNPLAGAKQWKSSATPDAAVADFVSLLLAIEPSDPRSAPATAALSAHFAAAVKQGATNTAALQSTFTVACMAPGAVGIGM